MLDNLTAEDRSLITHPDITNAELSKNDLEKTTWQINNLPAYLTFPIKYLCQLMNTD